AAQEEELWDTAVEEAELLALDGAVHDQELFEQCVTSPLIFASAMLNFGVHQILDTLCAIAPAPRPRKSSDKAIESSAAELDEVQKVTDPFSGDVIKVEAGVGRKHSDDLAVMRAVSDEFERGMQVNHVQSG